jgi:hypothetical protein
MPIILDPEAVAAEGAAPASDAGPNADATESAAVLLRNSRREKTEVVVFIWA